METEALISCLCVTERRVPLLRRAVACFLAQTWPARELVVVHDTADTATVEWLAHNPHPLIRPVPLPAGPRLTLGERRQWSVDAARGTFIATWDDDDWSAPHRLTEQMKVVHRSGRAACVLRQWIVYDEALGQAWLSQIRTWEASLVARKQAMPAYQAVERGEDLLVVGQLAEAEQLVALHDAHLYIYVYHGRNVGGRSHFKRHIFGKAAARLSPAFTRRVEQLLREPLGPPIHPSELAQAVQSP